MKFFFTTQHKIWKKCLNYFFLKVVVHIRIFPLKSRKLHLVLVPHWSFSVFKKTKIYINFCWNWGKNRFLKKTAMERYESKRNVDWMKCTLSSVNSREKICMVFSSHSVLSWIFLTIPEKVKKNALR